MVNLGELYLSHTSPEDGKGKTMASSIYEVIKDTPLEATPCLVANKHNDGAA